MIVIVIIQEIKENELKKEYKKLKQRDVYYALFEAGKIKGYISGNLVHQEIHIVDLEYELLTSAELDGLMRGFLNHFRSSNIKIAKVDPIYNSIMESLDFLTNDFECNIEQFFSRSCKVQ